MQLSGSAAAEMQLSASAAAGFWLSASAAAEDASLFACVEDGAVETTL